MGTNKIRQSVSGARYWLARQLREFTYGESFLVVARRLPFATFLRKGYQWLAGGANDILRVDWVGHEILFHVRSPREYRSIESNLLSLERYFLEALMAELKDGDAYLDVGSDVGEFVVPMAKAVGNLGLVVAIEPESKACAQLEANVKLNGFTNVRLFKAALGDKEGEVRLWFNGACPTLLPSLTGDPDDPSPSSPNPYGALELVDVYVGDLMMARERLPVPRAVKIDVEGFEYQVIRGLSQTLRNPACKMLCCEIHPYALPDGITPEVIIDEVKSLGFGKITNTHRDYELQMIASKGREEASAGAAQIAITDMKRP
jgi:FkbM family methyltransferase